LIIQFYWPSRLCCYSTYGWMYTKYRSRPFSSRHCNHWIGGVVPLMRSLLVLRLIMELQNETVISAVLELQ